MNGYHTRRGASGRHAQGRYAGRFGSNPYTKNTMLNKAVNMPVKQMALMKQIADAPQPAGFDWNAATVGTSVVFVAAIIACKVLRRGKKDDSF